MTAILDYGVGNLFSLRSSLKYIGEEVAVTSDPDEIMAADRLILPGVGAFGDAADKLREKGLDAVVKAFAATGKPLMGICLGMQLLFDESEEFGLHKGLGLIPGRVVPVNSLENWDRRLKIPHIGWNRLKILKKEPLLANVNDGECVYFVHSFCAVDCGEALAAVTEYGAEITASVQLGNVYGCQFHPEKSGGAGLEILRAFCGISGIPGGKG
ncbi:MAG: imidazole glycerol phosphate synthase subunit HisH [Clostridia bacterium]|nr:imidazole glycerol phosphate synthase subunit HisH [Clostridia bacterium]